MDTLNLYCGQRFTFKGSEFEITNVSDGMVSYGAVIGGKRYSISLDKFASLQQQNLLITEHCEAAEEPHQSSLSPAKLTKREVSQMNRRLHYAREILKRTPYARSRRHVTPLLEPLAKALGEPKPPSFPTVARWIKSYLKSQCNPISLVPRERERGKQRSHFSAKTEQIMQLRIHEDYMNEQRLNAARVRDHAVGHLLEVHNPNSSDKLEVPSLRTFYRRIAEIDEYQRVRARHGIYKANRLFKPAGRSFTSTRILETVEADGNVLDVFVVDPETGEVLGRPYGTAVIDRYSRAVLAFEITLTPFSAPTLLRALKSAISSSTGVFYGAFETLVVDNGSDYISDAVRNFCNHIGIRIEHAPPRSPNTKPFVERLFRTINEGLIHNIGGTTFSSPSERGDYKSEHYACITLEDLNSYIQTWLDTDYHARPHSRTGRAPSRLWAESQSDHPIHSWSDDDLDLIARTVTRRKISNGRVGVHNLYWYSHALATLEQELNRAQSKEKVDIYIDELDLGQVRVKDPRTRNTFITADSTDPDYTQGLSLYEHKIIDAARKAKSKEDIKALGPHALQVGRWELWKDIVEGGEAYAKKQRARLTQGKGAVTAAKEQLINGVLTSPLPEAIASSTHDASSPLNENEEHEDPALHKDASLIDSTIDACDDDEEYEIVRLTNHE